MSPLLRLLALMRPHAGWMALTVGLGAITMLASIVLLALSGWFITSMALAGLAGASINYFTPAAIIRACAMVRTGGRYAERLIGHDATLRFVAALRPKLFAAMERQTSREAGGVLLNRLKGDIDRLEFAFLRIVSPLLGAGLALVPALGYLLWLNPSFGMLVLSGLLAGALVFPLVLAKLGAPSARALPGQTDALNTRLIEVVEASAELAIHDPHHRHRMQVLAASEAVLTAEDRHHRLNAASHAGLQLSGFLALAGLLGLGAGATIASPDFALAVFLCLAMFDSAAQIPPALQHIPAVCEAARRLFALLDAESAAEGARDNGAGLKAPAGYIAFDDVGFTYPGAISPALSQFSLTVRAGERVALLGPSGSGKSTLAALLLRFHAPQTGKITLGGQNVQALAVESLREHIALLSQDAFLFSASVRENLLMARPEASQAELEYACRVAQVLPFIESLPKGFDSFVGAHGHALSGGQARRLALARALLRDAPVLVLDEPTEGLDAGTEAQVLDALLESAPNKTILLLTHRSARLERMNRILWIENGTIVGVGTPQEMKDLIPALGLAATRGSRR
ncbi:MAG: thiol reductant ABC exporter subunit CydC [Sphingomonadales bacterium]|nr:thiol reductant ABC exporter subunit CydC [Sphingomonadales bacterium]